MSESCFTIPDMESLKKGKRRTNESFKKRFPWIIGGLLFKRPVNHLFAGLFHFKNGVSFAYSFQYDITDRFHDKRDFFDIGFAGIQAKRFGV
jgi:hypothetical protein